MKQVMRQIPMHCPYITTDETSHVHTPMHCAHITNESMTTAHVQAFYV